MVVCKVDLSAPTTMTMAVLQEPPDKLRHMNASAAGEPSRAPWRTGAIPEFNVDVDISEVYFLIMHFLSSGPCQRAFVHLSNEILQHKLLPRRYHAVLSREGVDKKEDGTSFPLTYQDILSRNPTLEQDHLVKLLQQLLVQNRVLLGGLEIPHARVPTAADVPTLLGTGNFSLVDCSAARSNVCKDVSGLTQQLRWPHWHADQVHGLMLRQLGGGFARHHQAPSVRTPSYVIVKPAVLVDRIQIIKKLRGHRNAVYCAVFDGTGQYVITGSDDRLVKFWSAETGLCLRSCRGHEGDITDLAVSNRNKYVASASNDFCIRIWLLPSGVPVSVLRGHTASVTAIAFSPRQGCEHLLLSSSDDGTCRIWDASDSTLHSRVYMPNPKDVNPAPKPTAPAAPSTVPGCNQILCCAFNADGSIFVTGSSDKIARVWDACKWNDDVTGRPNYEMDTLKGHENDVNYVQFSGCAAPRKPLSSDIIKDEHSSRFRNSWFSHDSIVTCSRDGTAIIWMLQSLKPNVKVGRWQKAYHLRVPPPPMPPLPPRGNGPRQRLVPTPRGVNMIVWSLDNRFVLAAIMDHRICVWNAADGSLVHSLTGHDKPTFVLDVHPLNPRIAMSAGYDGRVIIWDIWEGCPIKVYETGEYTLVDGNFSPDGTSLVVSDEVGQVYIFGTGSKMSDKDVKYDQFFLGDFRPLARDTHGNVLDVETQLAPHNRNLRDLLCDAGMIPYAEPYQTIYQQRRLAYLGFEWCPPTQMLSIGTHDDVTYFPPEQPTAFLPPVPISPERHDRQGPVNGDRNRWVEQPPEVEEAMDWEQEVIGLSEDTGSDYSASDESLSEEKEVDGYESLSEEESNSEEEGVEATIRLRRSGRNKRKKETGRTASRRRVRGRTCNDHESSKHRPPRGRQTKVSRNVLVRTGRAGKANMVSSQEPTSRPKRQAARNALTLFDSFRNTPPDEDEDDDSEEERKIVVSDRRSGRGEREFTAPIEETRPQLRSLRKSLQEDGEEDDDRPNFQNKASTSQPEADNVGDCRRPRSQRLRKIVFKFRNPTGASNSPIQADRPAQNVGMSDEPLLVGCTSETPHAPEQSQKSFRKLIIKPPKRIDQGSGDEEDDEDSESVLPVMTRGSAKLSIAMSESDEEGLSHDEKLQQQFGKKGKAVSVAGAGGSSLSKSEQENRNFDGDHEIVSDLNIEDEPQQPEHLKLAGKGGMAKKSPHWCTNNKKMVELEPDADQLQELDRQVTCTGEQSSHLSLQIDCSDKLLVLEAGRDIRHLPEADRHTPSTSTSGRATNGDSSHNPQSESKRFLKGEEVNNTSFDLEDQRTFFINRGKAAEVKVSRDYIPHDDNGDEYGLNHEDEQEMLEKEGLETDRDHCEDEKSDSEESEDVQGYTEGSGDERERRGKSRVQRHQKKMPAEVSSDVVENSSGGRSARHMSTAVEDTVDEHMAGTSHSASHLKGQVKKSRKTMKSHRRHNVPQESDSPKNQSARIRRGILSDGVPNSGSLVERPLRITVKCPETTVKHQDGNAGGRGKQTRSASIAANQQQRRQDLIQKEKMKVVEVKVGVAHAALRGGWRASKQRPRVINNAWLLMSEVEHGTHYTPQFGDEVAYLQQGHKEFLKKSRNERGPWTKYRLGPVEFCRIIGLNYSIDTGLGSTSCMIQLEFTDASSQAFRQSFALTLPELTDHPDFIVEKSRYDASMAKGWVPRDHCKVWWANGVDYKGQWWDGRIKSIKLKSDSFPGSPWEKYLVSYKGAPEPTAHSPWELFDKYCQIPGWSVPQIEEKLKEDLLNAVCTVEDTLYEDEDEFGVKEFVSLVTDDPNFLNEYTLNLILGCHVECTDRFEVLYLYYFKRSPLSDEEFNKTPVPLTLDTIRERLQKDYYRSDEAVEHDVRLLVTNVELFCGTNHKLVSKMERLAGFILAPLQ